ncbi:hypothetical protein BpHYR1_052473 [Brachionus plicatilis]|uniref:Uncharacterized protein n=1 Tax=Brachionus plicatilis TaxID=10195 RepID=A0A3M7QNR9_BRAPC|nr:hypothetical protein BpHYR1_052473 [Brachionus plicatilis]
MNLNRIPEWNQNLNRYISISAKFENRFWRKPSIKPNFDQKFFKTFGFPTFLNKYYSIGEPLSIIDDRKN